MDFQIGKVKFSFKSFNWNEKQFQVEITAPIGKLNLKLTADIAIGEAMPAAIELYVYDKEADSA